jgi:aryl-phospho-beta-D-glucosidase BglC (GH1 family)
MEFCKSYLHRVTKMWDEDRTARKRKNKKRKFEYWFRTLMICMCSPDTGTYWNCGSICFVLWNCKQFHFGDRRNVPFTNVISHYLWSYKSRDSSVRIATGYGLDARVSTVRFPAGDRNFSLRHRIQIDSGAHPVSYPMGTGGTFPLDKAAGPWSWLITSI